MRRFLAALLALTLFALPAFATEWTTKPKEESKTAVSDDSVAYAKWEGQIDSDFLKNVRYTLESALSDKKIKRLVVTLYSPGGYVTESIESARLTRDAVRKGLIVEMHGVGLVASGATFVLAAGTPGKRYMSRWGIFLVHPPQVGGGFFEAPTCGEYKEKAESVQQKIVNIVMLLMRDAYVNLTGKPQAEVEKWLTCGNEQVGRGELAKQLGMADEVED